LIIGYGDTTLDLLVGLDQVYQITENVKWGMKYDNNILALKGKWVDANKFFIDFHEVGEPFYFDVELEFDKNNVHALFTWQRLGWKFILEGKSEKPSLIEQ
jgi:hypothetical protein